ncbi:GTPase IMAP member 4 [Dissophora globulifera]|nr:GTPase IMAP member 4 [Dissophora globulifera]
MVELGNSHQVREAYPTADLWNPDFKPTDSESAASNTTTDEYKNRHHARIAHILAALKNEDFRPSNTENVVVIGKSGSGKTSIISLLLGDDVGVGHGIHSKTTNTSEYDFELPVEYGDRQIKLIDTQGVLDTQISLTSVLESLIDGLTGRFYHVNTIMLILECARFTQETQDALESLVQTFGLDDIERSKRLLVVVTKVEHLPVEDKDNSLKSIKEHAFFQKFGISVEYLENNTIEVFAGPSKGVQPRLVPIYEEMRVESKDKLLRALARKNSSMTVSNDFAQKLTNYLTDNIQKIAAKFEIALDYFRT